MESVEERTQVPNYDLQEMGFLVLRRWFVMLRDDVGSVVTSVSK